MTEDKPIWRLVQDRLSERCPWDAPTQLDRIEAKLDVLLNFSERETAKALP